jgi:nucleotide-binding universal stress UspA family protein
MDIDTLDPVVVGVDGSAPAGRAALWAAEDARPHHRRLVLTCADTWPVYATVPWSYGVVADLQASRRAAHDTLPRALEDVSVAFPDTAVDTEIAGGLAPAVPVARSHQAAEVVVGRRSTGAVRALVRGSTAAQVAAHAHSPVVVVPDTPAASRAASRQQWFAFRGPSQV